MIFKNQAVSIVLTIAAGVDLSGASTTATVNLRAPSGTVTTYADATLDTSARTITKAVAADVLSEVGEWKFVGVVTINSKAYPCTAHPEMVYEEYTV